METVLGALLTASANAGAAYESKKPGHSTKPEMRKTEPDDQMKQIGRKASGLRTKAKARVSSRKTDLKSTAKSMSHRSQGARSVHAAGNKSRFPGSALKIEQGLASKDRAESYYGLKPGSATQFRTCDLRALPLTESVKSSQKKKGRLFARVPKHTGTELAQSASLQLCHSKTEGHVAGSGPQNLKLKKKFELGQSDLLQTTGSGTKSDRQPDHKFVLMYRRSEKSPESKASQLAGRLSGGNSPPLVHSSLKKHKKKGEKFGPEEHSGDKTVACADPELGSGAIDCRLDKKGSVAVAEGSPGTVGVSGQPLSVRADGGAKPRKKSKQRQSEATQLHVERLELDGRDATLRLLESQLQEERKYFAEQLAQKDAQIRELREKLEELGKGPGRPGQPVHSG